MTREVIGQHGERLMVKQRFIAVLRPGSGDQQHSWKRSLSQGQRERTRQRDIRSRVAKLNLAALVGKGWLRRLRSPLSRVRQRRLLFAAGQYQRQGRTRL